MKKNKIGMVKSQIIRKPTDAGESLEQMIRRCTASNEPIDTSAPMIYTEEANGVMPEYDIRTDRFDLALEAIDKVDKSITAKANEAVKKEPTNNDNNNGGGDNPKE